MAQRRRFIEAVGARLRKVTGNDFVRDVAKLVSGTVGGRIIALAALPFATRLYSPDDFATLATYLSTISIIAVGACLRLDIAIPLADSDDDAADLWVLALSSASAVGAVLLLLALATPGLAARALGRSELAPYLWLVPLGVMMAATYSASQFWATRARRFGSIARTRITQAVLGAGALLGLGAAGIAPLGLLVGNMLSTGAGGLRLALDAWRQDRKKLEAVTLARLRASLGRYRRYSIFSTPEALANTAGIHLPVILIAAFAGAEAGYLLLATQIMAAPMALLGSSIAQVYVSRAAQERQSGNLGPFTLQIVRRLIQIGVGPLILVGVLAPTVFPLVFGADWARAGQIVAWLTPWMALQFVASPISAVMFVVGRQLSMLVLTAFGLLLRSVPILVIGLLDGHGYVPVYAMTSALFYLVCCVVFIKSSRAPKHIGSYDQNVRS